MSGFKLASLLLQYPGDELLAGRAELCAAAPRRLRRFVAWWAAEDPDALRAAYVETFDFQRGNSLYLTYHSHGDQRRRGMALLGLKRRFAEAGLFLETDELPDYLPVLLEAAALGATDALASQRPQLEVLRRSLAASGSPYAAVLDAVCAELPRLSRREAARVDDMAAAGPPEERVGLEPYAPPDVAEALR
jgi:nitrate reductase delta subunit